MARLSLVTLTLLLMNGRAPAENTDQERLVEYPPYDGWYNNYAHPGWGGADTQLFRKVPPAYSDGTYEPSGQDRPSPMNLSRIVFTGPTGYKSYKGRTAFMVFFGQQLVEEILDAQRAGCPPEYINLDIPKEHEHYSENPKFVNVLPVLRTRYDMKTGLTPNNPRQQLNEISAWMDGTLVYGPNKAWTDSIREFKDGLLQVDDTKGPYGGEFPRNNSIRLPYINPPPPRDHPKIKPISRFNKIGNPRGNENPFLLTMGIMWFRYHNAWARKLKDQHPDWSDEKLFNEARKMVVGVYQKITTKDWLPQWLGKDLEPYSGYNPTVHPGVAHVFQSAAMRFGHTMVPPGVYRRNNDCIYRKTTKRTHFEDKVAIRTCNSFWNPQEAVYEYDIDEFIMGMASQIAEREDNIITPDLRGNVFGPLEFNRRDLMAINIQRARDHGIPDFNSVRKAYGLSPKTWDNLIVHPDIDSDGKILSQLKELYNDDFGKIDLWVAGMLEVNEGPGETFRAIIGDQFQRIRDGDRFWYENKNNRLYTTEEVQLIETISIKEVIMNTTTIGLRDIQDNPFIFKDGDPCPTPHQLNHSSGLMEDCTEKQTFDYFSGSEVSFVISLIILFSTFFIFLGILWLVARHHNKVVERERAKIRQKTVSHADRQRNERFFAVSEWQGPKEKWQNVKIELNQAKKIILVKSTNNQLLRTIDLKCMLSRGERTMDCYLSVDKQMDLTIIKIPREYDLFLRFDTVRERQDFIDAFKKFLKGEPALSSAKSASTKQMFQLAVTKEVRRKLLKNFFDTILQGMTEKNSRSAWNHLRREDFNDVLQSELTKAEFGEALGLTQKSTFLESIFNLADVDKSGSISFQEFLDLSVRFYDANPQSKMKLIFDMYDVQQNGKLTISQLKRMLQSMLELDESRIDDLVQGFYTKAGISINKDITFNEFTRLLGDYEKEFNHAVLALDVNPNKPAKNAKEDRFRKSISGLYGSSESFKRAQRMSMGPILDVRTYEKDYTENKLQQALSKVKRYIETYRLHIFWLTLYTLVCIGIFVERAYYYSVEREHSGLRRIAGDGVTVTRGAASGMMFTYGCLLLTMCRNMITALRETFLNQIIPFDAAVDFHKYISWVALAFTILHIIGHCINFYHVSTQTADDLSCLFRNFFHATHELPKFHDWLWNTITGLTGVLLTIQLFMIYIFATQYARRHSFRSFWYTHNTYVIFFALMFLHGIGRLVQPPFSHYFMLGPIIVFAIDQLISISRKKIEIPVVRAELLPSDVIYLEIKKPDDFVYKSGQWIRIACTEQGKNEYHPFTLSSAPHEKNLGVHIRGVGPWTYQLTNTYNPELVRSNKLPTVFIDGPYGEGHQDWNKFEIAVMVGGGIGVTPFTSILKDITHMSKTGAKMYCKKVYFLWITRTQKQFEWVTDIIRSVEEADEKGLVGVHIFITQFKQRFDIRTTMLYICEKHFQKISGQSLFTGLRSVTHFGRPDFANFFTALTKHHSGVDHFGVFSCGPPPMTNNVEKACREVTNKTKKLLIHHFENF